VGVHPDCRLPRSWAIALHLGERAYGTTCNGQPCACGRCMGRLPRGRVLARRNSPAQGAELHRSALWGDAFLRRYEIGRCPGVCESAPGHGAAPAQQSAKPIRIMERAKVACDWRRCSALPVRGMPHGG
jgi:hypothetical protein